jgi:[ribosomal protein S18]-alanine N-acetyltransferase
MATQRQETQVRLRSGGIDDLDEVMRIMTAAFPPCFGEAWTRSQCAGILPMQGVSLVLAAQDGRTLGFSLVRAVADEAELLLLAVDPAQQRRGIGQALLDNFIAGALACGAHRLHLEVRDGNPAIELYRASGFATAGRRRNYYHGQDGQSYDAVTLMLLE